jgi:integrase
VHLTDTMLVLSRRLVARWPDGPIFRNTRGNAWDLKTVARRFRQSAEALGIGPELCAYALRHHYATRALANGVPVATVATLLGHKNTNMVMRIYSKLNLETEHLAAAAEQAVRGKASHGAAARPARPGRHR